MMGIGSAVGHACSVSSYRAFDLSFSTQKEKARTAEPGLEKEREEEEGIQLWGFCGNLAGLLSFAGN